MSFNLEQISYDEDYKADSGFYIACKTTNNKEISRKPLSAWNLTKSLTCNLLVRTQKSNFGNLENPSISEMYKIDVTYTVNKSAKSLFLKQETQQTDSGSIITKIFLRDVNNGTTQPAPTPNSLYHEEHDLTIKRSKGKLISLKESVALLKSGECLGVFSDDLSKKMII